MFVFAAVVVEETLDAVDTKGGGNLMGGGNIDVYV